MKLLVSKLLTLAAATVFFAHSGTEKGYTVTGAIGGDSEGKTVYLYRGLGPFFTSADVVDSAVISNGTFRFSGETDHPDIYTLKFFADDSRADRDARGYIFRPLIPLYLTDGSITIEAVWDSIPLDGLSFSLNYDYSRIEVSGPSDFNRFIDYARNKKSMQAAYDEANRDYGRIYVNGTIAERVGFVEGITEAEKKMKSYAIDFITANTGNNVGMWVFGDNLDRFTAREIDLLSAGFLREVKDSPLGSKVLSEAARIAGSAVGAPFIDYSFEDKEGNPVNLSDHVGKGRYVLLEFWASWCSPCRSDIPHLKRVYELYHPEGFEIISISMDTDSRVWHKVLEEERMPWLQVSDLKSFESDLSKIYNFMGIPSCVLVGPDGTIVHRKFRGPRMDKCLIDLYGNKFDDSE